MAASCPLNDSLAYCLKYHVGQWIHPSAPSLKASSPMAKFSKETVKEILVGYYSQFSGENAVKHINDAAIIYMQNVLNEKYAKNIDLPELIQKIKAIPCPTYGHRFMKEDVLKLLEPPKPIFCKCGGELILDSVYNSHFHKISRSTTCPARQAEPV
jgi:hypothetical protein